MDKTDLLVGMKLWMLEKLPGLFPGHSGRAVQAATSAVDAVSRALISEYVVKHVGAFAEGASVVSIPASKVRLGGATHVVNFADDIWNMTILNCSVLPVDGRKVDLTPRIATANVAGRGRYLEVKVLVPNVTPFDTDLLGATIAEGLTTAARWVEEQLCEHFTDEHNAISHRIYGHWRALAGDGPAASSVWFVLIADDVGCFLFDPWKATHVLASIHGISNQIGIQPSAYMMEIANSRLNYADMNCRKAAAAGHTIDANIYASSFSTKLDGYTHAIAAMIGGPEHSIVPLVTSGRTPLFAGIPAKHVSECSPLLEKSKRDLERLVLDHSSRVGKAMRILRGAPSDMQAWQVGEFIGGFTAGVTKVLTHH